VTLKLGQPFYEPGSVLAATFEGKDGEPVVRRMVFDYEGFDQMGGVQGPPIHPNCRCDLEPVLGEEFA
jgi:hypothetical protein